jgi:hypothetical protein
VAGKAVSTAYAATSLECAAFETIFHDLEAAAPFKFVPLSSLEGLQYSTFQVDRPVRLASLYSADLMRFGLERRQVIDTPRSSYPITRLWSATVHHSDPKADGMIWVSRRYDQERALILFGDRVLTDELSVVASTRITEDPTTLEVIFDLGQRAGIDIAG